MLSRLVNALRVTLCLAVAAVALPIQAISAAELISCCEVSERKSLDKETKVRLTVKNGSTQTISIDWIESNGARSAIRKLAPGETSPELDSYACDAFLLHTLEVECLCGFVLDGRPEEIVSIDANGLCSTAKNYEPTARYQQRIVEGWTIFVSSAYTEKALRPVLDMVKCKLNEARRILPPDAIKTLQNVRLWFEVSDCTGATYHVNADWLSDHGMNPDKARGIQISADIVTSSDDQPGVILHELAHAFEAAQVLGPGRTELKSAYQAARLSGRYESVPRRGGGKERAYALTDVHEYFAELSEAYFSENDFYPFNRDDLEYFDPQGFAVIESLWKVAE